MDKHSDELITKAADIIKNGGLVAFPTETVYGLGADAFNINAVERIYEVKGRPRDNPLIIHISDISQLSRLTDGLPDYGYKLIEAFWPGPLTLIIKIKKGLYIPAVGDVETVAVRMPSNETACRLIERSGTLIAAPSANSSGKPSPTLASHVQEDLSEKVDMILDGGAALYGLDSTIVDTTGHIPCLLRPGGITVEMLRDVIGSIDIDAGILDKPSETGRPKAPGMKYKHYSPSAEVIIVDGSLENIVGKITQLASDNGIKTGIMATDQTKQLYDANKYAVLSVGDRNDPLTIAANLYDTLRRFDKIGVEQVYAESFPETGIGLAIMNRLKKAAGYVIIKA